MKQYDFSKHKHDNQFFVSSQVREGDLVMPEQARAVAKELGLPYYETSVLTYFGVNQVSHFGFKIIFDSITVIFEMKLISSPVTHAFFTKKLIIYKIY